VVQFFSADSIPGDNFLGWYARDEELFASKKIETFGQRLGLLVGYDRDHLYQAARLVCKEKGGRRGTREKRRGWAEGTGEGRWVRGG
jgi:xanthine dehydrogenase molybdopterin-binding subunit B